MRNLPNTRSSARPGHRARNLCCIAIVAGAALVSAFGCTGESAAQKPPGPAGRAALVELAAAGPGMLSDGWRFLGRVEPIQSAAIAAAVAGRIVAVNVREGNTVAKREPLIRLDSTKVRAELAAAKAKRKGVARQLRLAKRQFRRVKKLGFPSSTATEREAAQREVSDLKAQLDIQRAEMRRVRVDVNHHSIRAPFAGVVGNLTAAPGAWVRVGEPLLSLVSLDDLEVLVDVSADLAGHVDIGQMAKLVGPNATADAEIAGIVGALDAETRTMRVRLVPREQPPWLLAGMAVDVEFMVTLSIDGVTVPRDALVQGAITTRVIKFADGKAVPVDVEVVSTAGKQALIRGDGLAVGDQIVVRGNDRLRPGQRLEVIPQPATRSEQ